MYKEIGGYFGLHMSESKNAVLNNGICLNTARNCLRYVIQAYQIKEIYIPYYTCPVVWQAIQKENCKINFYHIDEKFMPKEIFEEDAFILYTNYFGVCAKNVKALAQKYKNLIVDNAHAFYMPKYGIASFNSLRKFFGLSDGAILNIDKLLPENFDIDISYHRFSHLLKRIDVSAQFGYEDFCTNEKNLDNEPIKLISNLTRNIFSTIDIDFVKKKRLENFKTLDKFLFKTNELKINLDLDDVPMVYPYLVESETLRQKLIKNKIYVAQYWTALPIDSQEGKFQKYLLPLPIDQRYDENDMQRILSNIGE